MDGAASPRGTPGRDDASPAGRGDTRTGAGALPEGHPQLLPGLFACYRVPNLPSTNNALEQFFGAYRYHDRRTTERKVASAGLGLSGAVWVIAAAAARLHTYSAAELAPENVRAWQALRQAQETRRQHSQPQLWAGHASKSQSSASSPWALDNAKIHTIPPWSASPREYFSASLPSEEFDKSSVPQRS